MIKSFIIGVITGAAILSVALYSSYFFVSTVTYSTPNDVPPVVIPPVPIDTRPVVEHIPLPEQVKTIYMTACALGTLSFRADLLDVIDTTEVNSIMIDIRDYSGSISFPPPKDSVWYSAWQRAKCGARDAAEFIATLHSKGVYVIGRITVFQDPYIASQRRPDLAVKRADGETVWRDYKGLSFIDVGAKEYWDEIVELTKLSYNLGFDELNYDYIRYPSDGPMRDISFPHSGTSSRADNLERFFIYLNEKVSDPELYSDIRHNNTGRDEAAPYLSADLFGFTATNRDDLSIGQIIERAFPYFDFIAPMVYPSHYPYNHLGLGDPNDHPYLIVNHAMKSAVRRATATTTPQVAFAHKRMGTSTPAQYEKAAYTADNLRTWIQDFDYGGDYDAADVRAQIKASYDAGVDSWMIWSPSNRYTRAALESATTDILSATTTPPNSTTTAPLEENPN